MTDDSGTLALGSLMTRSAARRPGRIQCASGTCRCPQRAHWYSGVALSQATECGCVRPQDKQATGTIWRSKRDGASEVIVMAMTSGTGTLGKHLGGRADSLGAHSHNLASVAAAGELDHRRRVTVPEHILGETRLGPVARDVCGRRSDRGCRIRHGRPPCAASRARAALPFVPEGFARGRGACPPPATAPPTGHFLRKLIVRALQRSAVFQAHRAPITGPALTGPGGRILCKAVGP